MSIRQKILKFLGLTTKQDFLTFQAEWEAKGAEKTVMQVMRDQFGGLNTTIKEELHDIAESYFAPKKFKLKKGLYTLDLPGDMAFEIQLRQAVKSVGAEMISDAIDNESFVDKVVERIMKKQLTLPNQKQYLSIPERE